MGNKTGKGLEFKPENVHLNTETVALIDEDLLAIMTQIGKEIQRTFTKSNVTNRQLEKRLDEKIGDLAVRIREWNAGKRPPDDYQFVKEGFHQLARVIATIGTKMDKAFNYRDASGRKKPRLVMHNGDTPKKALDKVARLAAIFSNMSTKFLDRSYSYKLHTKPNGSGQYDANSYNKDFRLLVDMMGRKYNFDSFASESGKSLQALQKINALLGNSATSLFDELMGGKSNGAGGVGGGGADYTDRFDDVIGYLKNIDMNVFKIAHIIGQTYGIYMKPHPRDPVNKPRSQVSKADRQKYGRNPYSIFPIPKNYHVNYDRKPDTRPYPDPSAHVTPKPRVYMDPFRIYEQKFFKRAEKRNRDNLRAVSRINRQITKEKELLNKITKQHSDKLSKVLAVTKGKAKNSSQFKLIEKKFKKDEEDQQKVIDNLVKNREDVNKKTRTQRRRDATIHKKKRSNWWAQNQAIASAIKPTKDELDEAKKPKQKMGRATLRMYKSNSAKTWGAKLAPVPDEKSIIESNLTPFEKEEKLKERQETIKQNKHDFRFNRRVIMSNLLFGNSNWFANPKEKNMLKYDPWDPKSDTYNPFDGPNDRESGNLKQYVDFLKRQRKSAESAFADMFSNPSSALGAQFDAGTPEKPAEKTKWEKIKERIVDTKNVYVNKITSPIKRNTALALEGAKEGNMPALSKLMQDAASSNSAGKWSNTLGAMFEQYGAILDSIPGNKGTIYENLNKKYDPDSKKGKALNKLYQFSGDNINAGGLKGRVARGIGSAMSSTKGGLLGKIGGMFTKLALPVAGIFAIMKKLVKSSPILQSVLDLLNLAVTLFFMPIGNTIGEKLLPAVLTLVNWAVEFNKLWTGVVVPILQTIWDVSSAILNIALVPIKTLIGTVQGFLSGKGLGESIKSALSVAVEPLNNLRNSISENIGKVHDWLDDKLGGAIDWLSGWFKRRMDGISDFIENIAKGIGAIMDWIKNALGGVGDALGGAWDSITGWLSRRHFATGGVVNPIPGGQPIIAGDGGEPEYIVPQSKVQGFINQNTTMAPTIVVNISGPIYGMNDFDRRVEEAVNKATARSRYR